MPRSFLLSLSFSTSLQKLIQILLRSRLPEELEEVPFWQAALEAALSYTSRHYTRLAGLHLSGGILDYCLGAMVVRQEDEAV